MKKNIFKIPLLKCFSFVFKFISTLKPFCCTLPGSLTVRTWKHRPGKSKLDVKLRAGVFESHEFPRPPASVGLVVLTLGLLKRLVPWWMFFSEQKIEKKTTGTKKYPQKWSVWWPHGLPENNHPLEKEKHLHSHQFSGFHGVFWMTDPVRELTSHISPFTGSSENQTQNCLGCDGMWYVIVPKRVNAVISGNWICWSCDLYPILWHRKDYFFFFGPNDCG